MFQWIILVVFAFSPALVSAGAFTPYGLYEPQITTLANGLRVVLNPRPHAHNVAFRLVVNIGAWNFPCGQSEIPHFLEHLLFAGTSKHSEAELESLVKSHGGSWNAETGRDNTVYEFDIYSQHAEFGLDLLYEIVTDSQFAPEQITVTRSVINRESGGEPSAMRRWLYRYHIGRSAVERLLEVTGYVCKEFELVSDITRKQILDARDAYYVGPAMTLIIVGDFDPQELSRRITKTFGRLPATEMPHKKGNTKIPVILPTKVSGTFSPFVDSELSVGFAYPVTGYTSEAYSALQLLKSYLDSRLYEVLRIERGLAYAPTANYLFYKNQGLFFVTADVDPDDGDKALDLMRREIARVMAGDFEVQTLSDVRRGLLLEGVQGLESNTEIADYYANSIGELEMLGQFRDEETELEHLTEADLKAVAVDFLTPGKSITLWDAPTLTFTQMYWLIGLIVFGLSVLAWRGRSSKQ